MTDDSIPSPKDPLALGLGSLAGGVGFGSAFMTASQIFLKIFQGRFESIGYWTLSVGFFAALGIGGICGWYRSYQLDNLWQRGVITVLAAVGAILIGFLAAPLDRFFGVVGMIVWLVANIALGIMATRWANTGKGTAAT